MSRERVLFWGLIAASLLLVVVFETEILLPGMRKGDNEEAFLVTTWMELLTICSIPLTLKHLRGKKWMDIGVIGGLLVLNTLLYYIYMNSAFGYMAIVCLICTPFVYKSKDENT